jgi:hypothetical protein
VSAGALVLSTRCARRRSSERACTWDDKQRCVSAPDGRLLAAKSERVCLPNNVAEPSSQNTEAKRVKRRYRGVCRMCGASTWGAGPSGAATICARCNGAATRSGSPARSRLPCAWHQAFGKPESSTDLSLTHARPAAAKDDGVRLRRLRAGWACGDWPAANVVQYHYGMVSVPTASP